MLRSLTVGLVLALSSTGLLVASADAVPPGPTVDLKAPRQAKAGVAAAFKIKINNAPAGTKVYLQRKAGSRWVQVAKAARKGGAVRVTSPIGKVKYRAVITKKRKVLAASETVTVRSVANTVPLSTLCRSAVVAGGCDSGVVRVGYQDFRFTSWLKVVSAFLPDAAPRKFDIQRRTSCTGLTLRVSGDSPAQEFDEAVWLGISQGGRLIGDVRVESGVLGTLSVPLARAPFFMATAGYNGMAMLSGEATGCSTPTGVL